MRYLLSFPAQISKPKVEEPSTSAAIEGKDLPSPKRLKMDEAAEKTTQKEEPARVPSAVGSSAGTPTEMVEDAAQNEGGDNDDDVVIQESSSSDPPAKKEAETKQSPDSHTPGRQKAVATVKPPAAKPAAAPKVQTATPGTVKKSKASMSEEEREKKLKHLNEELETISALQLRVHGDSIPFLRPENDDSEEFDGIVLTSDGMLTAKTKQLIGRVIEGSAKSSNDIAVWLQVECFFCLAMFCMCGISFILLHAAPDAFSHRQNSATHLPRDRTDAHCDDLCTTRLPCLISGLANFFCDFPSFPKETEMREHWILGF